MIFTLLSILSPLGFAETKIAVIDLERAVLTTEFARQQQKALTDNAEYKALVEKFQLLKTDLQTLEKEANDKGMTWSSEQAAEHTNKVKYKSSDYQLVAKKIESQRNSIANVIEMLAKAITAAGTSTDMVAIAKALEGMEHDALFGGKVMMRPVDHQLIQDVHIVAHSKDGVTNDYDNSGFGLVKESTVQMASADSETTCKMQRPE